MLNEYPKEFVYSVMKPSRSNRPSDTIDHGTIIILYVKGILRNSDALGTVSISDTDENWTGLRCPADVAVRVQHPM
jgi:hypothetical protein